MIPTLRLAVLAALGVPLALLALVRPEALWLALAYDAGLLIAAIGDRLAAADPRALQAERITPDRWVQGRPVTVELPLRWPRARTARLTVRDLPPVTFDAPERTAQVVLRAEQRVRASYRAVPRERGRQSFGPLAVRSSGPLGLVERQTLVELARTVKVYPDLVSLTAREAALTAPSAWTPGIRRGRAHGEGREFHQLRDYVPGDDLRLLDWKAFAHRGRPTVREFRVDRNQRVLLVLDAGRLMTARVADRLRFDWAVQAAGRLARAVLAVGDSVGLVVYSRDLLGELPPAKGAGHVGRMAELLADARPGLDESDLGRALAVVRQKSPRRTLIVVFTEIADPRSADALVRHVGALSPRHLGLVVSLADTGLERERQVPLSRAAAVYTRVAAEEVWQDTRRTVRALETRGALVVRARADALAGETVERYLEIKRRGRL